MKIRLRVLYLGEPGSAREKDFVGFLEKHFTKVGKGDLEEFKQEQANDYDVVIMDVLMTIKNYAIHTPRVDVGREYGRPTMMLGAGGALICDTLSLKTGYL